MPNQSPFPKPSFLNTSDPQLPKASPSAVADPPRGVVFAQPDQVSSRVKRLVDEALFALPSKKRALMVKVDVETKAGTNAVIAYQTGTGLQAAVYAGKSGWDQVVGVKVVKVWE